MTESDLKDLPPELALQIAEMALRDRWNGRYYSLLALLGWMVICLLFALVLALRDLARALARRA